MRAALLLFCNSLWIAEILILMYLQDPLIKPRKQWGGELDCQECIFSFFSSYFFHLPGSSVQKLHLFSQAHQTFSTKLLFLAFSKTCVKLCLDEQPCLHIGKICNFGKILIFPLPPPPNHHEMFAFRCPLLLHTCSGKELGHCVSKFEQINLHGETLTTTKAWFCPAVVYLCCLWATCGEEVYIIWSERHWTKRPPWERRK